jgi:hypothetical protein
MSMSIKITDTQLVLMSAAAQREDRCLIASPTLKGGAAHKVANKLISAWRRDEGSGASCALKLTAAGAEAIAVEDRDALANDGRAAAPAKSDAKDARPTEGMELGSARPSAPRDGSKLAQVIELLQRDHGARIEELIAVTGWLAHTTRAALTDLRKRGYAVQIDRSDDKRGSFYHIPAGETGLAEGPAISETAGKKPQRRSKPQAHHAA